MKRLFHTLLTVTALITLAASCVKEPVSVPDPALGGTPVPVTFNLDLGLALSKADAPASSALDDGSRVNKVFAAVFGSDGSLISTSKIGGTGYDPTASMSGGKASVTITLSKGQEYKVIFFVQKDDTYSLSFANGNRASFAYKTPLKANDPDLDAFWAAVDVKSSVTSYNVTLKRPFAQLNVLVPAANVPEGKKQFSSAMTVKAAPASFDLFAGKAGSEVKDLTFADNAISAPAFGKYAADGAYSWIGMNFVLVPDSGKLALGFKEKDMVAEVAVGAIPVRVNGRTNLVGALFAPDEVDGTFNVWIDSGIGGGDTPTEEAQDTEITIADGSTYTKDKPLEIDASTTPNVSVKLSINGDTISQVNAGAEGGKTVTAVSRDPEIATAKVVDDLVQITPVADGETVVTVTTPSYTKTIYKEQTYQIPVRISGVPKDKVTPVLVVTDPADKKLSLEIGQTAQIKAELRDGETVLKDLFIYYASSDEEVASVSDMEGLVTALKAGETTITLTSDPTGAYNTAEPVTIAVTVTEPVGPEPEEPDGDFVKVTHNQSDWSGEYLIVYDDTDSLAFNGGLEKLDAAGNNIPVVIQDGKIAATAETKAAVFTIAKMEGGYSIKAANGEYIGNTTQSSGAPANGLTPGADALLNTINFTDGVPQIVSNTTELKYNKTKNQERFRYYTSGNKQQAIALYKLGGESGGDEPGGDDGPTGEVVEATLTVTPETLSLKVGETGTITAETNSSATPTFASDKEAVATVDANGKVTAVAEGTATITVSVAAVEGKFTAASETVKVTVTRASEEPIVTPEVTYKKVSSITSGANYILVGLKGSKYYAATPLASDRGYGRLNGYEITVANDEITQDLPDYEFTITAVDGGYNIAMPDGRLLACDAQYNGTFQIGDSYDHVFTIAFNNDGTVTMVHKGTDRTVYHGGGDYTNFSCSSDVPSDGTLIMLFSKDGAAEGELVTTGAASGLTTSSATLSGSFSGFSDKIQEVGFEWGTSSDPSQWHLSGEDCDIVQSGSDVLGNTASGSFTASLEGLGDGHTYYYRAYVMTLVNQVTKTYYGTVKSFSTVAQGNKPSTVAGWFELPGMDAKKSGNYLVKSDDADIYYAYHMCSGGEKGPNGKTARNYTVAFSAEHHCPVWVAAPRHSMYVGNSGRNDSYRADPDIPSDIQYSSKSVGGGCNKGHMLGSAERTSSKETNKDVFFYSNIAPQLSSGFNTGNGGWNILEDWVDKKVCSDTLYVVIGCYFDKYKDGYGYTVEPSKIEFGGRNDVSMPTMFYYLLMRTKSGSSGKALKDCTADEIMCAAFVRCHTNDLQGQKVSRNEMMSVADLEQITGFTYFPNVPNLDKSTFNPSDWGL